MFEEMKFRHLFGFMLLALFAAGFASAIIGLETEAIDVMITAVMYLIVPIGFFMYHFRKQGVPLSAVVQTKGVKNWLGWLIGIMAVSIAFSLSVFWLQLYALMPLSPGLVGFMLEPIPMPENTVYLAITVVMIAVIGPIAEEFIFRGVLLKRMALKTSMWGGIIISSLFFGILHADVIGAFAFGVIASLLYLKTGNLLVPILLHIFNNSFAMLMTFVAPTWPESVGVLEVADIYANAVPNAIMLAVSSILTVWIIIRLAKGTRMKLEENTVVSE